jgi:hypothetical protein
LRGLSVHVLLDNLSARKMPEMQKLLMLKDRRRGHVQITRTSSSWTNLVKP